jgi:hypothetical protein
MLFGEISAVYCEDHKEHTNILCGQNTGFFVLKQLVGIVTIVVFPLCLHGSQLDLIIFKVSHPTEIPLHFCGNFSSTNVRSVQPQISFKNYF